MNKKMIGYIIGKILILEAGLMVLPLIISFLYNESTKYKIAYGSVILLLLATGFLLSAKLPKDQRIQGREGYIIVSLSWILMSMFGALPFVFTKEIPSFVDAFFEIVSGFTTTGSSIIIDLSKISHSNLFWRSFTHFVGGMGVLVLALAIFPSSATSVHVMKAEVPGPTFGKLVSKLSTTARMLYKIYIVMTIAVIILLMFGGLDLFESSLLAFGTAGTGGFGVRNGSILPYNNPYVEIVLGIGMLVFGLNFNLFYLLILGNIKQIFKSEEAKYYLSIVFIATAFICINIYPIYSSITRMIRDVFFTVSSIITTTGYSTVDFDKWPTFSKIILMFLMFCGGCAGSTAGGFKVSRLAILIKRFVREFKKIGHPNKVLNIKLEGKTLDKEMLEGVDSYFILYSVILFILLLITAWESDTFITALSAVLATFNNIGPGLGAVGPTSNFGLFSPFLKFILSLGMLLGRLEIIPLLILVSPRIYRKRCRK